MKNTKFINFFIFFIIFIISFGLFGCFGDKPINSLNDDIEDVINKIELLENISKNYDANDYSKRTTIYIRCKKYDSLQWTFLGGKLKGDFENYVQQNQGDVDLQELQYTAFILDPITQNQIDFLHMFATINLLFVNNQIGDLGGWGGDLCQLVQEVSNKDLNDEQLEILINQKFNHESSFNAQDLLADIDAVNITNQYNKQSQKYISKEFKTYYETTSQESRIQNFKKYLFEDKINCSVEEKCNIIFERLKNNNSIKELCNSYGIDFETNKQEFDLCIKVFVNHFE